MLVLGGSAPPKLTFLVKMACNFFCVIKIDDFRDTSKIPSKQKNPKFFWSNPQKSTHFWNNFFFYFLFKCLKDCPPTHRRLQIQIQWSLFNKMAQKLYNFRCCEGGSGRVGRKENLDLSMKLPK